MPNFDSLKSLRASKLFVCAALALAALPAFAEMSESTIDKVADIITIVVMCVVPVVGISVIWMVHVLPEKIAHQRHHPQREAITTLCLLSLLFGGLLWPLAWLWAYTKPIGYRAAYGTDKHDDYYEAMAEKHRSGGLLGEEMAHLRDDLEAMEARGALPPSLKRLKQELSKRQKEELAGVAPTVPAAPTASTAPVDTAAPTSPHADKGHA